MKPKRWEIFLSSIFFVLGFSVIFSLVGVLLQSVLYDVSYSVQAWLGRIGGTVIILFGLYIMGLIRPKFLEKEHKLKVKRKFSSTYITSFVFGAAFAVGWTPCVGAVLGAVLTLAVTQPGAAFFLMLAYSLGLGIPFLVVGLFTEHAQGILSNPKIAHYIKYVNYVFGVILVIIGIFVFTNQLSRIANLAIATDIIQAISPNITFASTLSIGVAFLAGIVSFLSPCVLPLIPAFLSYLATVAVKE